MAVTTKTVKIVFEGKDNVSDELTTIKDKSKQTSKSMTDAEQSAKGLSLGFAAVAAAAVAAAAAIGKSISLFAEQERVEIKLQNALRLTNNLRGDSFNQLKKFASAMQEVSTVGDEQTLELISQAVQMGRTTDQAKELIEASIELSAVTGKDVNSSFQQLSASYTGLASRSLQLQKGVKALTVDQLKSGEAVKIINENLKGTAKANLGSLSAQTKQVSNAFGDLLEDVGKLTVGFTKIASGDGGGAAVLTIIKALALGIRGLDSTFVFIGASINTVVEAFGLLLARVNTTIEQIKQFGSIVKVAFSGVEAFFSGESTENVVARNLENVAEQAKVVEHSLEFVEGALDAVLDTSEFSKSIFDNGEAENINGAGDAIEDMGEKAKLTVVELEKLTAALSKENLGLEQQLEIFGLEGSDAVLKQLEFQSAALDERIAKEGDLDSTILEGLLKQKELLIELGALRTIALEDAKSAKEAEKTAAALKKVLEVLKSIGKENRSLEQKIDLFDLDNVEKIHKETQFQVDAIQLRIKFEKDLTKEQKARLNEQIRLVKKLGDLQAGKAAADNAEKNAPKTEDLKNIGILIAGISTVASKIDAGIKDFASFLLKLPEAILSFFDNFDQFIIKFVESVGEVITKIVDKAPELIQALVEGIGLVIEKLIEVLPKIATFLVEAVPVLIDALLSALPELITAITDAIIILIDGLPAILESIMKKLPDIILSLFENLPRIFESLGEMIPELVETFADNIGPIVTALIVGLIKAIPGMVKTWVKFFTVGIGKIAVSMAKAFINEIKGTFKAIFGGGIKVKVPPALENLPKNISKSAKNFAKTVAKSTEKIFAVKDLDEAAKNIGVDLPDVLDPAQAISDAYDNGVEKAKAFWDTFIEKLQAAWRWINDTIIQPMLSALQAIWKFAKDIIMFFVDNITKAWMWVKDNIVTPLTTGITKAWMWVKEKVIDPLLNIGKKIVTAITDGLNAAGSFFKKAGGQIWSGLKEGLNTLGDFFKNIFSKLDPGNLFKKIFKVDMGGRDTVEKALGIDVPFIKFAEGGRVPGTPITPGDSERNDKILALLSPGEAVIPRSLMNDPKIAGFIDQILGGNIPKFGIGGTLGKVAKGDFKGAASDVTNASPEQLKKEALAAKNSVAALGNKVGSVSKMLLNPEKAIKDLLGFVTGDMFDRMFEANKFHAGGLVGFANGGEVPATLQSGEFVVNRSAVNALGVPAMKNINNGNSPGQSVSFGNIIINARTSLDEESIRSEVVPSIMETIKQKSLDGEFVIDAAGIRKNG